MRTLVSGWAFSCTRHLHGPIGAFNTHFITTGLEMDMPHIELAAEWAMIVRQAHRRLLVIVLDAARLGPLPRRSYVAPSPHDRSPQNSLK